MSKDIRSFFTTISKQKAEVKPKADGGQSPAKSKKRSVAFLSSDEDEVKVASPAKRQKATKKSKKRHIVSDSEDEISVISEKASTSKSPRNEKDKPGKTVLIADVFGTAPIKMVKAPIISKKLQKEEAQFHSDDDFEATLCQLDTSQIEMEYLGEGKADREHSKKRKTDNEIDSNKSKKHKTSKEEHTESKNGIEKSVHSKKGKHSSNEFKDSQDNHKNSNNEMEKKRKSSNERSHGSKSKHEHEKQKKDSSSSSGDMEFSVQDAEKSSKHFIDNKHKNYKSTESKEFDKKSKSVNLKNKSGGGISKMVVEKKLPKLETKNEDNELNPFEERIQKKKQSVALYQQYLNRGGASNPGSKEIPEGAENCLAGLSFLITGVLESLEREEADELIKKYGGRILHQVSKKTDYVVVGDQSGPAKLQKANNLGIKKISEDDLLELIRTRPVGKASNIKSSQVKSKKERQISPAPDPIVIDTCSSPEKEENKITNVKLELAPNKKSHEFLQTSKIEAKPEIHGKSVVNTKPETSAAALKTEKPTTKLTGDFKEKVDRSEVLGKGESLALVDKYRPKTMKQIVGQQGDRSNAKKLYTWLQNWNKNHTGSVRHAKPSPWAKNDDGSFFKAAMLSGPPGVGKTTTVQVVCNELGLDPLEFNASDTRSKRLLKEEVSELLNNTTMKGYFTDGSKEKPAARHVLVMDEVDGMAGNEDRGGLQELINLIKSTHIPVICICNDRNNPKMRTLANYTFDLKFQKPRVEQIRAAMMSMCFKENIKTSAEELNRLIEATNQDIRQVINHLAMLSANTEPTDGTKVKQTNKDLRLGPWDVVRKVFSAEEHKKMSIHDKSDLFFHDYNIASLFVQENYLSVVPNAPKGEILERVAKAADSIAMGDLAENAIRSKGAWNLLPMQAFYSSVIPGTLMSGQIVNQINFPSWLGRNSKRAKFDRMLQEITVHTRLATSASKDAINLDYLPHIRNAVVRPLAEKGTEGVQSALNAMNDYHLLREDLDSLVEVSLWPGQRDPMQAIESKVKAAFTRAYNKSSLMIPYATTGGTSKKKAAQASQDEGFMDGDDGEFESEEEDDNPAMDAMIKAKKFSAKSAVTSVSKKAAGPSKRSAGRGKGK